MKKKSKFDFSGYATKVGLKCSDGRIIQKDAFKHMDGETVPLVWQHIHNEPSNVLGHSVLEARDDGIYAYGKFNDTEGGKNAKALVSHGDITSLSIYANRLKQKGQAVYHGVIRELSLVLSGANPGALIDNVSFAHADGSLTEDETEAIIYTGLDLEREVVKHNKEDILEHAKDDKTVKDIFDTLSEEQKNVVYAMLAHVVSKESSTETKHSDDENGIQHSNEKGEAIMKTNVFDQKENPTQKPQLTRAHIKTIFEDAKKCGSLKESFLAHMEELGIEPDVLKHDAPVAGTDYGITNIDYLFPDARTLRTTPDLVKRDDSWVAGVMAGTHHTPFSRIKSMYADLTADDARAKGYITGSLKKEEVFPVAKRSTTPTTVYKKQRLDRDDIIDITDFDVVVWLKAEMRLMLNEELARAVLIGDGRAVEDEDRINPDHIRPIWTDHEFYSYKVRLESDTTASEMVDEIIRARKHYKGSGAPAFYTTTDVVTDMLLLKDKTDRRIYATVAELAAVLRVSKIVEVEVMEGAERNVTHEGTPEDRDLIGLLVNLKDYTIGADKGGKVAMFDDFDIDYNQHKYLIETRCSGALTKWQSAVVIEKVQAGE